MEWAIIRKPEREIPYLKGLNPEQIEAVTTTEGPVLVLAGAGTGKTRVLTMRLAHILATQKATPSQIMALTFTNKAAAEIRERVSAILKRPVEGWFLGTFHSIAARLLRPYAERIGLKHNFTILGEDDQLRLIKQLLEIENIDEKKFPPRLLLSIIERWKDRGLVPEDVDVEEKKSEIANGKMSKIYSRYQQRLKELNACDFGDLLLHQITLLRQNQDVLDHFQNRFRYFLVDEYQDTNIAQYLWLRLLSQKNKNICVVGDEDQSIYSWRGAEVENILRFEKDFPETKVIRLEENYRSTGHILEAASYLISHNKMRLGKTLRTSAGMGEKVQVYTFWDGEEESRWITDEIENMIKRGISPGEIAIMVRAGFQTRSFEERFITIGIPYRVFVGSRFYERQEIRDAIAYLRLLCQPDDDLAFERIINVPKRGIGPATLKQLHAFSRKENLSLSEATLRLCETDELKPKLRTVLGNLMRDFMRWRGLLETNPHTEVAQIVLDESGYTGMWQSDKSPDAPGKLENLKELIGAISEFDNLPAFLEHVSLVLEAADQPAENQVSIMTLHSAKGLEFSYVFLPGWEEEIFPSRLTLTESGEKGLEEERRLAYVGLTRARKKAVISYTMNRFLHGSWINPLPSRFIAELPDKHIKHVSNVFVNCSQKANFGYSHLASALHKKKIPGIFEQIKIGKKNLMQIEGSASDIPTFTKSRNFYVGCRIIHEKFGSGKVLNIEGEKLEISFDKHGIKKVISAFVLPLKE